MPSAERQLTSPEAPSSSHDSRNSAWHRDARFYETLLATINDFAYLFDLDGRFRFVNKPLLDLWGLSLEEAVGKNFFDLKYPDELAEKLQRQIQAVIATGKRIVDETQYISPSGVVGYYEYIFSPVLGSSGSVDAVAGTTRDISERRRSDQRVRAILESITDAFFAVDREWRFSYVNPQAESMLGRTPGDLLGKIIWDVYPGLINSEFERIYRKAMTDKVAGSITSFYPDHERWYEVHVYPSSDGISIYFRDVTEQMKADTAMRTVSEQLDRQSRLFERIASSTLDFIYVFDLEGRFLYANRRLLEVWGTTFEQAVGKNLYELGYPKWHADMHMREIKQLIETKQPVKGEVPFTGGSGISGVFEYIFTPVLNPQGEVEVIAGTTRDVSDRKHSEQERQALLESERSARADADRASRMKDEFLATLSHELRTPLNAILGWATILGSGKRSESDLADGLQTIERNARAQTQIIEDLLDMSRIISGKVRLDVQRVELTPIVRAAVDSIKPTADAKGVRVHAVLDPSAGIINGDPNRLQQIFWNLLTNAVKFTPKGGHVQVVVARVDSQVEITVADTGEGIRPEFLPHVFDRFRQSDASTTRRFGGLGLGLAIVKQLVELHGGNVRATSPGVGQGSTFAVVFPLTAVHLDPASRDHVGQRHSATPNSGSATRDDRTALSGVKVLVVDDEPDARNLIQRLLDDAGASVRTAASAEQAIMLIESERPDVLVSDIGMPKEDGYSLIRRVRALGPQRGGDVPALALTAYARSQDRVRALRAGYETHIAKPVEPAELLTVIASLSGRRPRL